MVKKKENHHLHSSSNSIQAITFLMRFVRNHLLPRCQCRCHGIESNVHVVSTESHRQMSIDRTILNYRFSNRSDMTLIPKVSEERTQIGETERDDKNRRILQREFFVSLEKKLSKYFSPAARFTVVNCIWFWQSFYQNFWGKNFYKTLNYSHWGIICPIHMFIRRLSLILI